MAPLPRSATWSFSAALGSAARSGSAVWRSERAWPHAERPSHGLLGRRTLRRVAFFALALLYAVALLSAASGWRAPTSGGRGLGGRRAGAAAGGAPGGAGGGGGASRFEHAGRVQGTALAGPGLGAEAGGRVDAGAGPGAGRADAALAAALLPSGGLPATGRWALARGAVSRAHDGDVMSISSLFSSLRGAGARGAADAGPAGVEGAAGAARSGPRAGSGAGLGARAAPEDPLVAFRDEGFLVPLSEALDVELWEPEHVYDADEAPRRLRRAVRRAPAAPGAGEDGRLGEAGSEGDEGAGAALSAATCPTGPVRVLIGVASRCCVASARAKRAALRAAWAGGVSEAWPEGAQVRFFVSQPPLGSTPEASAAARREAAELLREEIAEHGDLVVLPGEDGYRELPVKTLQLFRHGLESPCNYTHVAKIDDDVYLRVDNLRAALETGAHEWNLPIEAPDRGQGRARVFDGEWVGAGPEPGWALAAKRPRERDAGAVDHAGLLGAALATKGAQELLDEGSSAARPRDAEDAGDAEGASADAEGAGNADGEGASADADADAGDAVASGARRTLLGQGVAGRAPTMRADGAPGAVADALGVVIGSSGGLAAPGGVETPGEAVPFRGRVEEERGGASPDRGQDVQAASLDPPSGGADGAGAAAGPWMHGVYLGAVDSNRSGTFPGWGPLRDPRSKWYLSEEQLSDAQADDLLGVRWISGWAYVLSADLVRTMLDEAYRLGGGRPQAELRGAAREGGTLAAPDAADPASARLAAQGVSSAGDPRALVGAGVAEALAPGRDESAPALRPLWWGRMPWEDVLVARLLRDASSARIAHSAGFKASWDACDARTVAKHLDVDAPRLVPGLRAQELSGLWRHKEVVCSSADADVGDYAGWRAWRNGLGDSNTTGMV